MNFNKKNKEYDSPKPVKKQSKENDISVSLTNTIRKEVNQVISSNVKEISDQGYLVIDLLAKGKTDLEVLNLLNIEKYELDNYYENPAFVTELRRKIYGTSHAVKDNRIRGMNRIMDMMLEQVISNPLFMEGVDPAKLLDLYAKYNAQLEKTIEGDKPQVQIDITQIIKENLRDATRLKESKSGELIITSKYPTLDDNVLLDQNGNIIDD